MRPARRQMPLVLGLMSVILLGVTTAWAAVTVSPTTVNFGNVVVGTPATRPVTVQQSISGVITSARVSFSGKNKSSFSSSPTKFKVSAGSPGIIIVTFTPTNTGTFSAQMKINWVV